MGLSDTCVPRAARQGFFGADCGNEAARLAFDAPLQRADASFEYDFFQLPDLSPSALTHSIEARAPRVAPRARPTARHLLRCRIRPAAPAGVNAQTGTRPGGCVYRLLRRSMGYAGATFVRML